MDVIGKGSESAEEKGFGPEREADDRGSVEELTRKDSLEDGLEKGAEDNSSENEDAYSKIISKIREKDASEQYASMVGIDAEEAARLADANKTIDHLVKIASSPKGVMHAVKVARHLQDNYVLDVFQGILADELHDALVEKGIIDEN